MVKSIRILAGICAAAAAIVLAPSALAQNIDTRAAAGGTSTSYGYGGLGVAAETFGQTFTVPVGQTAVSSFSFKLATIPATATFRGVLMQWDSVNSRAIGPVLYQSADVNTTGATVQDVTFTIPGSATVTAGQKYVIFGSIVNSTGSGFGAVSRAGSDVQPGGGLVFQFGPLQSDWTGTVWNVSLESTRDLGVTVNFAPPVPVPTLSEWAMILFGLMLAGGAAVMIQRRKVMA